MITDSEIFSACIDYFEETYSVEYDSFEFKQNYTDIFSDMLEDFTAGVKFAETNLKDKMFKIFRIKPEGNVEIPTDKPLTSEKDAKKEINNIVRDSIKCPDFSTESKKDFVYKEVNSVVS